MEFSALEKIEKAAFQNENNIINGVNCTRWTVKSQ